MLPGDSDTVFGQAAQASALAVIEAQMETSARNAITQLRLDAEKGGITADEYQVQLNGLIDGYSSSLAQLDPVAAVNFEASIAATANTNLLAYAKEAADKAEAQQKIAAEYDVEENLIPNIGLNYSNGITENGVTPDELIDKDRKKVVVLAYATENMALIEQFDKERQEQRNGYFADWASTNYIAKTKELKTGAISDPSALNIWSNMDDDERRSALEAIRKAEDAELSQISARRRQEEAKAQDRSDDLIGMIYDKVRGGDLEGAQPLIEELESFDRDRAEKFTNLLYVEGGIDRASVVQELDIKSLKGTLTLDDLINAPAGSLTTKTFNRFLGEIKANKDERHTQAVSILSNYLGSPETLSFGRTGKPPENLKTLGDLKTTLTLRGLKEEDFDPIKFAEDWIKADEAKDKTDADAKFKQKVNTQAKNIGLKNPDGTQPTEIDDIVAAALSHVAQHPSSEDDVNKLLQMIAENQD